jgi:hypothetical protein
MWWPGANRVLAVRQPETLHNFTRHSVDFDPPADDHLVWQGKEW